MTTKQALYAQAAIACILTVILTACGGTKASEVKPQAQPRDPLEITADADLLKDLKLGEVRIAAVTATLRVAGRVEADETRMARVSSPVTGRITELHAMEGQWVKHDQLLATVHSTDLSNAQSALLKASSQQILAERAVARARQLLDAGVIGAAELQRREADLQQTAVELSSARDQLKVLGMPPDVLAELESTRTVNSVTQIVSSIDGMLLERKVTIGQVVQSAEAAFVVADLSNVWLVADIPEQSAAGILPGKVVEAQIPAVPRAKIAGTLSFVSPVVNPETRTIRVRLDLPNPELRYKPAMLATMTVLDGAEDRPVVPVSAVVRDGNEDYVFVQTKPNTFVLHPVSLGLEFRGLRVLENGLQLGEKIVSDGAFHLNNERRRRLVQGD